MPGPFPGMDPFLEDEPHWPAFQHLFVTRLCQTLLPAVVDRYQVRVAIRRYSPEAIAAGPVVPTEHAEEFIEICDARQDGRLVTLIDVVSPANKTTPAGRRAYLATWADAIARGAGAIEIDLVRRGEPTQTFSREKLPPCDYCVTVTRPTHPGRFEVYTAPIRRRLPKFKVPLAATDRDALLDLQDVFDRAYEAGGFRERIDYRSGPRNPVRGDDRLWLDQLLREKGLRGDAGSPAPGVEPPADEVAVAAYYLWEREGYPHGRDQEHWYRAIEQLRRGGGME